MYAHYTKIAPTYTRHIIHQLEAQVVSPQEMIATLCTQVLDSKQIIDTIDSEISRLRVTIESKEKEMSSRSFKTELYKEMTRLGSQKNSLNYELNEIKRELHSANQRLGYAASQNGMASFDFYAASAARSKLQDGYDLISKKLASVTQKFDEQERCKIPVIYPQLVACILPMR